MPIYKIKENKLTLIKEKKYPRERDLQSLVEKNLAEVFNLQFVSSEFPLNNLRIDTLAFDEEARAFVVIEYKNDRSTSVIDQGFSYLALLLNNKADFILEYNEKLKGSLKKNGIDWSQSRVLFVSPKFTKYQRAAIGFQDLPIELWEVALYEGKQVSFRKLETAGATESIKTISKSKEAREVAREIKTYSLDDHFKKGWEESRELFDNFSQRMLNLDPEFVIKPVKSYIGFKIGNRNVVSIYAQASKLLLELIRVKPQNLKDPDKRTRYRKNSYKYFNVHITLFDIVNEDDIDYAMFLTKQVYKKFFT